MRPIEHKSPDRLIVDVSSLCWTSLSAGVDAEFGRKIGVTQPNGSVYNIQVNGYMHGYENAINSLVSAWEKSGIQPKDTIMAYESGSTKAFRQQFLESYKGQPSSRPQEAYEEFAKLRDLLITTVRNLGGTAATRPNLEGDDLVAYLVSTLHGRKVIWTGDRDLAFLLYLNDKPEYAALYPHIPEDEVRDEDKARLKPAVSLYFDGNITWTNPLGHFKPQLITLYKALVGDASDNVKGVPRFGPKAWLDFLVIFDDDQALIVDDLVQQRKVELLESSVQHFKPLSLLIENKHLLYNTYAAVKLYPERVESLHDPIQWYPGMLMRRHPGADKRLMKYMGANKIVTHYNFVEALKAVKGWLKESPDVGLDLETSTPQESDEWVERYNTTKKGNEGGITVDVIGSEITSLILTLGSNRQYTLYFPLDHTEADGIKNITPEQMKELLITLELADSNIVIHNVAFELPVIYNQFGRLNPDKKEGPLLSHCFDTQVVAAYVDENTPKGLKYLSKNYFGYDQVDYNTVTQGRKMNQMTATETLSYGADDTITTGAFWDFGRIIMEVEGTLATFLKIEVKSAYLSALAFAHGTPVSARVLNEIIGREEAKEKAAWAILTEYLVGVGWEGSACPEFTAAHLANPKEIKALYQLLTGDELKTQVRTPDKIYKLIGTQEHPDAPMIQGLLEAGDVAKLNALVAQRFDGRPNFNPGSDTDKQTLLYKNMRLPLRWANKPTELQMAKVPGLKAAYRKFSKIQRNSRDAVPLTDEDYNLLIDKGQTGKEALAFALKFDLPEGDPRRDVVEALQTLTSVATQRGLYFNNYKLLVHWKTGKIHAGIRQASTVTLRHTGTLPNVQQLSKPDKGDIRSIFVSSYYGGFILSADMSGIELRLAADLSKDENMLACFVGDNLKDMHSLTASNAMRSKWGDAVVDELMEFFGAEPGTEYEVFRTLRAIAEDLEEGVRTLADQYPGVEMLLEALPDSPEQLRHLGKSTNFSSQYGGMALKLSEILTVPLDVAEILLAAKIHTYSGYEEWKTRVEDETMLTGYATSYGGIRRHLAAGVTSDDKWLRMRTARQASNHKIQCSGGEMLREAMCKLWDSGIMWTLPCNFMFPVHDELVIDSDPSCAVEVAEVLFDAMNIQDFMEDVPVTSELSIGWSFYHQPRVHLPNKGADFCAEAVKAHLDKLNREKQAA